MFEIINESGVDIDPAPLEKIASELIGAELPGCQVELDLLICDSIRMRKLNRAYRGKDTATDVLSFLGEALHSDSDNKGRQILRGDIVIDINQADIQKGSHSLIDELKYLLIHGLLHLLGYDHIKQQDKEKMEHKESYYRQKLTGAC